MSEYPIQISKVQAPPLREETLARDRLLDWLGVKVHRRVVLVVAEAGYGKTTLLADFSRRTRVRTLWYRLDRGDRDWVAFLAYLVAAFRVHVPGFAPATDSLLRETAASSPPRDTVLDTFLRELGQLPADPTALVFDDFHLVDDAADIRHIATELLARAPERLAFIFLSRRSPPLSIARLRALGEVAELVTDDLRFDADETERLFRESYEMRLEHGLIAELSRRTEGWAASLQLVRTALHDRDPGEVRAFIRSLSGAEGHLYDYLAEEVVGDLPLELQGFLMKTALLETIDLDLGPIAADVSVNAAKNLIDEGERLGLFGRRGPHTRHQVRAHPLVRDFLEARLARSVGGPGLIEIHRRVAAAAESFDWRIATHHYLAAGDEPAARRVLSGSIETILATGAYAAAEELSASLPAGPLAGAPGLVLASRLAQQRGETTEAARLAEEASEVDPRSTAVLVNLVAARSLAGNVIGAIEAGRFLAESTQSPLAHLGRAYERMISTSVEGNLVDAAGLLRQLVRSFGTPGDTHYRGVALSNYAYVLIAMGDSATARASAEEAIQLLERSSSGIELVSARLALASALAHAGDLAAARLEIEKANASSPAGQAMEVAYEAAEVETLFGAATNAERWIQSIGGLIDASTDTGEQALLVRGLLALRSGDLEAAERDVNDLRYGDPRTTVAFEVRRQLAKATLAALQEQPAAAAYAATARAQARAQAASFWEHCARLIEELSDRDADASEAVVEAARGDRSVVSVEAELVLRRFGRLHGNAVEAVTAEAASRPSRWRPSVRVALKAAPREERHSLARLLSQIGEQEDIALLRDVERTLGEKRTGSLSRALARRLAPRVVIEDLGKVRVTVDARVIDGSEIRRKVLALLCFLVSKQGFAATREEVLDRLWPDLDPDSGLNSLNQTVYFLRRVFEPEYREDTSPGYLGQDGETIWLDGELIEARSQKCREVIKAIVGTPTPEQVTELMTEYVGKFALDFAYEEWAATYRDSLHASYLRIVEEAIRLETASGYFTRGIALAERASEIEPDAEEIQLALVRLYRLSGAHAAAAEQYTHYAAAMRELGVEPPALAEV
jgi:LuxR family maltose regulon positive regulatory protein